MKKALKIIAKIVSVIITLLVLVRFISLLDFIGFDFGVIADMGWYIPGWVLGFIGCVLNFVIYKKIHCSKPELILSRISAFFCMIVALLDLFALYVISRI